MAAQDTKNALVMINKAVALQPNNYDYLSRQAEIAYQAGAATFTAGCESA